MTPNREGGAQTAVDKVEKKKKERGVAERNNLLGKKKRTEYVALINTDMINMYLKTNPRGRRLGGKGVGEEGKRRARTQIKTLTWGRRESLCCLVDLAAWLRG